MAEHDTTANDAIAEQERMRVFATPHYLISTISTRWRAISCATPTTPMTQCRNVIFAPCVTSIPIGAGDEAMVLAILRNVCIDEFTRRRGRGEVPTDYAQDESVAEEMPVWQEPQASPE